MEYELSCGGKVSGRPDIVADIIGIDNRMQEQKRRWIETLRSDGIVAAHPDDGWVDRDKNELHPCYPQFDDGIKIGAIIALGWPEKFRLVRIIGYRKGIASNHPYWKFEAVEK